MTRLLCLLLRDGSEIFGMKAIISEYVRRLNDLGPVPINGDIDGFYARLVELDQETERSGAKMHASQNYNHMDPKLGKQSMICEKSSLMSAKFRSMVAYRSEL